MHPLLSYLGAAGLAGQAALLFVLFFRKQAASFPVFTAWIGYLTLETFGLIVFRNFASNHSYFVAYWAGAIPDYVLQLALLYEIARSVLLPNHRRTPAKAFWILGVLVFLSLLITIFVVSHARHDTLSMINSAIERTNLTFSLLRCLLFASITIFADLLADGFCYRLLVDNLA